MNTTDVTNNGSKDDATVKDEATVPPAGQPTKEARRSVRAAPGSVRAPEKLEAPKPGRAEPRKISLKKAIQIFAQVLTLLTLLLLWDQTHQLAMQTRQLAMQTQVNQESLKLSASAAELSFNLDVMARLEEVQFKIADDDECFRYVWGPKVEKPVTENGKAEQCGDAELDVLSMALAAVDRMPGFSRNNDDWSSYTTYVMEKSPNLKQRVLDNPKWWPEVTPYAQNRRR